MKLGILYIIGGSLALTSSIGLTIISFIPIEGTQPSVVVITIRAIIGLFLGLYMLPRGLLKLREAKHESQTR